MNKRLFNLIIIIGGTILILSTLKAIFGLWKAGERVEVRERQVGKLEQENKRLQSELERSRNLGMAEKLARDKLNLVRPGEVVVILPKELVATASGELLDSRPNWKKWWDLVW